MKIDQIVGNPPFSDTRSDATATNTNSLVLYDRFVELGSRVSDSTAMIIPAGWTAKSRAVDTFRRMGLKAVRFYPHTVFPTVYVRSGITAVYLERGYQGPITVTTTGGETRIQARHREIRNMSSLELDVFDRIQVGQDARSLIKRGHNPSIPPRMRGSVAKLIAQYPDQYSETATDSCPTRVMAWINGSKGEKYVYTSRQACRYHNHYKVIGGLIAGVGRLGSVLIIPPGVTVSGTAWQIPCDSLEEAQLIRDYFDSPLVRFIVARTKFNDILVTGNNTWRHIPVPPFREWLDQGVKDVNSAVETWLGLTPDEIQLISR